MKGASLQATTDSASPKRRTPSRSSRSSHHKSSSSGTRLTLKRTRENEDEQSIEEYQFDDNEACLSLPSTSDVSKKLLTEIRAKEKSPEYKKFFAIMAASYYQKSTFFSVNISVRTIRHIYHLAHALLLDHFVDGEVNLVKCKHSS